LNARVLLYREDPSEYLVQAVHRTDSLCVDWSVLLDGELTQLWAFINYVLFVAYISLYEDALVHLWLSVSKGSRHEQRKYKGGIRKDLVGYSATSLNEWWQCTLTVSAPARIFPHDTASSGRAPESDPSNSWPVLIYTE